MEYFVEYAILRPCTVVCSGRVRDFVTPHTSANFESRVADSAAVQLAFLSLFVNDPANRKFSSAAVLFFVETAGN